MFSNCWIAKLTTLRAALAPAVVLTFTEESEDSDEVVLRPISDAFVESSAKF